MDQVLRKKWIWHLLFWSVYLVFKIYHEFVWIFPKYEALTTEIVLIEAFKAQVLLLPVKVIFTYWLVFYLLEYPISLIKKWLLFLSALIFSVILFRINTVYVVVPLAYHEIPDQQSLFNLGRITSAIIDILLVAGLVAAIELYRKNAQAKKNAERLEKDKLASELKFLKQQTNPHFFLNTLNNLYVLSLKNTKKTPSAIMQLSKLMKFLLYESSYSSITLDKEVNVILDYIELEKLRYGDRLDLKMNIDGNLEKYVISPLVLLPLVENAFTHGASENPDQSFISITLKIRNEKLYFTVKNNVSETPEEIKYGIGLGNLESQLKMQYPEYELSTNMTENIFSAHLSLNLQQNGENQMLNY